MTQPHVVASHVLWRHNAGLQLARMPWIPWTPRDDYLAPWNTGVRGQEDTVDHGGMVEQVLDTPSCEVIASNLGANVVSVSDWLAHEAHPRRGPKLEWTLAGDFASYDVAKDYVAPASVTLSRKTWCTVCHGPGRHYMQTRYLDCKCRSECQKRLKIMHCLHDGRSVVYKHGQYGDCIPPHPGAMTRCIRNHADRLFAEGITPSRAQHRLKNVVPANEMPPLKQFQNRACYFRLSTLSEHSKPAEMAKLLMASRFDPRMGNSEFFSFGFSVSDGAPDIGYGGATGVFKVGVTTKTLLRTMERDPSTFVFHWDATYKINSMAYPLLICGITDPGGTFHPVGFFLIGKESTDEYEWAMNALMSAYEEVVRSRLQLDYVMADAALAPIAATKKIPELNVKKLLMCFYHCVACVYKRLGAVQPRVIALVLRHLYRMHYSRSKAECDLYWHEAQEAWGGCEVLVSKNFTRYFEDQWLGGDCCNWQVYHTPPGFPTTNNPCELFNKHFKGIYTQRTIHGLCATFVLLGDVAVEYSTSKKLPFELTALPGVKLRRRFSLLMAHDLLQVVPPHEEFQLGPDDLRIVGIVPTLAISMAFAFEDDAGENEYIEELATRGITTMPCEMLATANAYYSNNKANNVRHESICSGNPQPSYGWHDSTVYHCRQERLLAIGLEVQLPLGLQDGVVVRRVREEMCVIDVRSVLHLHFNSVCGD
ncbi:hypothetical protein DYB28_007848 [Aphanomyces astaci]|uniref:MULE transposase domain-containing protein n=1 Tax=Aphanomyces astaci TaxID=112090 RepID=A0A9X8H5H7_APHAT|nr:hypothetical protein DYB28_007848 [Aphanomyces astaci]